MTHNEFNTDFLRFDGGKKPLAKWSICYLWKHLLVPEHRIPIWVILRLRFKVEDVAEDMEIVNLSLYVCINTNIVKNRHGGDSLDE